MSPAKKDEHIITLYFCCFLQTEMRSEIQWNDYSFFIVKGKWWFGKTSTCLPRKWQGKEEPLMWQYIFWRVKKMRNFPFFQNSPGLKIYSYFLQSIPFPSFLKKYLVFVFCCVDRKRNTFDLTKHACQV